jgi:hypothetical protein
VYARTVSPSVHPRPVSGGATDFFPASALSGSPTGLATSRWRRRAMRPTDVCHPIELRAPAPRAFPARSRSFRCADTPWSLGLHAALPGDRTFHDVRRPLRRIVIERCSRSLLPHGLENRAWALSSHGADPIEPLTPLSRPSVHPRASDRFRAGCHLAARPPFERFRAGRRCVRPAKTTLNAVS